MIRSQAGNMIRHAIYVLLAALIAASFLVFRAHAMENIIRPYQSPRAAGMGNVRITTGIYDENFFGNPARVVDNPKWRITLFDMMFETTPTTISAVQDLVGAKSDVLNKVGEKAGDNLHGRVQTTFPGYYSSVGSVHFGLALLMSTQFDVNVRRSYQLDPVSITDVGPAFTIGRRFLGRDRLAVGVTTHFTYRLSTKDKYSFINLIQGDSLSPLKSGGDGTHLDFGVGATYDLPWSAGGFSFHPGFSVNNVLDGRYSNLRRVKLLDNVLLPRQQPRAFNFGVAARRPSLFVFSNAVFALEFTDIGNNENGSIYRLIHLGGEVEWLDFMFFRAGINQGWPTVGYGLDLRIFELDVAYYGEEMTYNPGGKVDQRIALRFTFKI